MSLVVSEHPEFLRVMNEHAAKKDCDYCRRPFAIICKHCGAKICTVHKKTEDECVHCAPRPKKEAANTSK